LYRFVFLGPEASPRAKAIQDLTLREQAYLYPLVILLVVFGIYPKPLLELVRPTVLALLGSIQ
jgi:NADH-quinone oxidoreductase subunit M